MACRLGPSQPRLPQPRRSDLTVPKGNNQSVVPVSAPLRGARKCLSRPGSADSEIPRPERQSEATDSEKSREALDFQPGGLQCWYYYPELERRLLGWPTKTLLHYHEPLLLNSEAAEDSADNCSRHRADPLQRTGSTGCICFSFRARCAQRGVLCRPKFKISPT